MLKFTERPKTPRITSKKNIAFPEGNKLFAGDFVPIWMKQTLIWFNLQRDGIKETFAEDFCRKFVAANVSSATMYEHLPTFGLSISYDGWTRCKEKKHATVHETTCNSKLKFT